MANFDFTVTSENGSGTGDLTGLNNVIAAIDQGGADAGVGNTYTITLGGNFKLSQDMLALNLDTGATLAVVGGGHTIDGGHTSGGTGHRGFFVLAGDVTLDNMTIAHARAQGGAGGTGQTGGGGGAGLGGGLFMAGTNVVNGATLGGGTVTLNGVSFAGDVAFGGAGGNGGGINGYVTNSYSGGGGGGMGGNGGNGGIDSRGYSPNGGGGGLGLGATGGSAASFVTKYGGSQTGAHGIIPGALSGGAGGSGAAGGAGGGGGGASGPGTIGHPFGPGGGGGGVGAGDGTAGSAGGGGGGTGGFGGGGGGTYGGGGLGGFGGGGGGGGGTFGGSGGFGGGGGGSNYRGGGNGGFGAGYGGTGGSGGAGTAGGGGGLGAGGAIFVQEGGHLTIGAGGISGGVVQPGAKGNDLGGTAKAFGAGIFIQGNQSVALAPGAGQTLAIADVIADMDGSPVLYRPSGGAGILEVTGAGTVKLSAADTYTGGTMLGGSATFELGSTGAAGSGAIDFASGTARLMIDGGVIPANTIGLLQTGDVIDAAGFQGGSAAFDPGTNTLTFSAGTASLALTLDAAYAPGSFASSIDTGGTGLAVTFTACYATGTRILTARGEVPIEELREGERVVCASRRLRPVGWIGHRRVDLRGAASAREAWPVRVRKGAFGAGLPARDLWLSPDHAVHQDGVLIPVRYLLNGTTIVQERVATIEYWHLELPAHDVVFAETLAAESYLDTGNRAAFDRELAFRVAA